MAKNKKQEAIPEDKIIGAVMSHYAQGRDEMTQRRQRKNGWNDVIKAYFGSLPANWPYLTRVSDPVIRTAIIEKNSRLLNSKLKGRLTPREGGDAIKAKINNAILDFQWDQANEGGSMLEKWILMVTQARLFGASFGMPYYCSHEGFEGNEFSVIDNRDIFVDFQATHVRNANWVQVREWMTFNELKEKNESSPVEIYKNLGHLETMLSKGQFKGEMKSNQYESQVKMLRGLQDKSGYDTEFPLLEVITEFRKDRLITFIPRFRLVIRDIENPYRHKRIPIVQLRFYSVGDDVYGESEVEPVLPIYRAINATLCGFLDESQLAMRPPIKVANNQTVRMDTLQYGPNALWLVGDNPNNVTEHVHSAQFLSNFQTAYTALKSAFNTAMGETSLGTSNIDPVKTEKTATEVNSTKQQQLSRDQFNQLALEESLKDMMMFWLSNNQQFFFSDPQKTHMIQRITGPDMIKELKDAGLAEEELDNEAVSEMGKIIEQRGGQVEDGELQVFSEELTAPKYPIVMNPNETNPDKIEIGAKMTIDDSGEFADIFLEPDDMVGMYDYVPDVKSMAMGANEEQVRGRKAALDTLLNPAITQQLLKEGYDIKMKSLISAILSDTGLKDAERFFEKSQQPVIPRGQGAIQPSAGIGGAPEVQGMGVPQGMAPQLQQMAQPQGL